MESYSKKKTKELIKSGKKAVDILLGVLKTDVIAEEDDDGPVDNPDPTKLLGFVNSKKAAFFTAKELIKEIDTLESQLETGDIDLNEKEFSANVLEDMAGDVS